MIDMDKAYIFCLKEFSLKGQIQVKKKYLTQVLKGNLRPVKTLIFFEIGKP